MNKSIVPLPGEIWKDIRWTDGIYQVSNMGRIRRTECPTGIRACFINSIIQSGRYPTVRMKLSGKKYHKMVHKMVAEAFLGECPQGMQVNHKNGIKTDSSASNLEYCTPAQNMAHAYRMGLLKMPNHEHKGCVHWNKKQRRWRAQIDYQKHRYFLGSFLKRESAQKALSKKIRQLNLP